MRKKNIRSLLSLSTWLKVIIGSTSIEPCSINTVQEVVKKNKSKQLFLFYVNIEKFTNRLIGKLKMPLVKGRCTANRIIKWVLNYRKQNVGTYVQNDT